MALNLDTLGLAATVTEDGITAPDYQAILSTITGYFQQIYGADAYLEPDSKDGQMVALLALAIHDANNTAIAVYNSYSPTSSLSDALTRNVKINGILRKGETRSTVDLTLSGTPGTTITNGSAKDTNNIIWNLPASVTIGTDGTITATATCNSAGPVAALTGSITAINTPTRGWLAVTNATVATVGMAIEGDADLRIRQAQSVALPSLMPFDAIDGALANIAGVTRHKLFENDTGSIDANGIPGHTVSAIVDGGDATVIAQTIRGKKGPGVGTYGNTSLAVADIYGNPHTISFSRPTPVPVFVSITLQVFTGYTTQIGADIQQAVSDYINSRSIGENLLLSRLYSPANLGVLSGGNARYYDITEMLIGTSSDSLSAKNVAIAYDQDVTCVPENVTITVAS